MSLALQKETFTGQARSIRNHASPEWRLNLDYGEAKLLAFLFHNYFVSTSSRLQVSEWGEDNFWLSWKCREPLQIGPSRQKISGNKFEKQGLPA